MKIKLRQIIIATALLPLALTSISASAAGLYYSSYDKGYDHGYDDGYDDAMDDCPCPPWRYLLGGFYVGAGAGYEGFQVNSNPFLDMHRIGSFTTHANGWDGRLFGGYGNYYRNLYLGSEVFVGSSNASGNNFIDSGMTHYYGSFQSGVSYGAALLPGFKLNDGGPLFYGRLGYVKTQLNANDWSGTVGSRSSDWVSGFKSGVGIELPVYNQLDARFEYSHTKYSSINHNTNNAGSTNSPSSNGASLDLIYHIGGR